MKSFIAFLLQFKLSDHYLYSINFISMGIIEAFILGIVEGITEFLPISSTGHMIITSSILGIQRNEFTKLFEICIQLGAILAVVVLYARKFFDFRRWQFYGKLIIGVIPAIILGFLFSDKIDKLLESPMTVAISTLTGGIILLFIDNVFKNPTIESDEQNKLWQIIYYWHLAMPCHDTRNQPQCGFHYRRHATKIDKKSCCRIFFFPGSADYGCRNRI